MIPYNTGPCHIYLNPQGNQIQYLGTCETAPEIQWDPAFVPVFNDITGPVKPYDMIYVGKDATVFGDLTVFNWAVYDLIRSLPVPGGQAGTDAQLFDDIGTLMVTEDYAYDLWIQYPHYQKAVMRDNGMPPGRHFIASWLIGPHKESPGTKANSVHIQFYAIQKYDAATGRLKLGDNDMTGIPAIPPSGPLGV